MMQLASSQYMQGWTFDLQYACSNNSYFLKYMPNLCIRIRTYVYNANYPNSGNILAQAMTTGRRRRYIHKSWTWRDNFSGDQDI